MEKIFRPAWSDLSSQERQGGKAHDATICGYIDKVFDFETGSGCFVDERQRPEIDLSDLDEWLAMFAMHRGSLNAIESELRIPKRLDGLVGSTSQRRSYWGCVLSDSAGGSSTMLPGSIITGS